jgi:hypothetical protein
MIQSYCSTVKQRVQYVSEVLAEEGSYGVVTQVSRTSGVSRQTLYSWKAKGQSALEEALTPARWQPAASPQIERAVLTLLVEGHASYRGIQTCVESLLGEHVSLGTIVAIVQRAGERAQQWIAEHAPETVRALALDELYSSQRGEAYLSVVDVHSAAVWATTSPVAVDGESWTLLCWQLQEQGVQWETVVSDGGKAIADALQTVTPSQPHQRDVWHVLHRCQQVQGRLDRLVERLETQTSTVARQAARLAKGERPRGAHPQTDVAAHAALLAQAQYLASSLRYLSEELRRLVEVVVLAKSADGGVLSSQVREGELETVLALLDEVSQQAPAAVREDVTALVTHLRAALPHLVLFAPDLDAIQDEVAHLLGAEALHLLAWAGPRRAFLGPSRAELLAGLPAAWQPLAERVFVAWEHAVRASSVVENWHSVLRPYLAVHRTLSTGLVALLAVWHNHRVAPRGLHRGQSPLQRTGLAEVEDDWLVALGYPPAALVSSPQRHSVRRAPLALVS